MQNSRRYCVTARDKIAEENRQLISRIGKSQFDDLEHTHGVKITAQNLYDIFPADFVLDTVCPILKNMGDHSFTQSVIGATKEKMLQFQHNKKYQAFKLLNLKSTF